MPNLPAAEPLYPHRPGVWIKPSWLRFAGVNLQTRMVVLELEGGLLLYSPSPPPDETLLEELHLVGTPRWLLAPNELHTLGVAGFQAAFPGIHSTGCPGHARRVPKLRFDLIVGATEPPWARPGAVRYHVIGGNAILHEVALLHEPSGTLLVADAVEYFVPGDRSFQDPPAPLRWMLQAFGIAPGEPCMSPEHNMLCVDPDALEASLEELSSWSFDSLVMSHGRIVEGAAARETLRSAFVANLARARRRWPISRRLYGWMGRFG
jgi:hypothetical protein